MIMVPLLWNLETTIGEKNNGKNSLSVLKKCSETGVTPPGFGNKWAVLMISIINLPLLWSFYKNTDR